MADPKDERPVPQRMPIVGLCEAGEYYWCSCGRSKNQPYCDGSHKTTTLQPLRFVAEASGTFNLCGCKTTDDEPYCDGSHNVL